MMGKSILKYNSFEFPLNIPRNAQNFVGTSDEVLTDALRKIHILFNNKFFDLLRIQKYV